MYGNASFRDETPPELTPAQRKHLRSELSRVAARTRELLPGEFIVGAEISTDMNGPRATVAVQPPVGSAVSATCPLEDDLDIDEHEQEDIATGLAASAALQVKAAMDAESAPPAG